MPHRRFVLIVVSVVSSGWGCGPAGEVDPIESSTWAVHTVCGGGNTVKGIDVSKWQTTVSWSSVAGSGVKFAIARISDGLKYKDAYFDGNWKGIKSAGLIRGSYQYFRASQDAAAQADYVIQAIKNAGGLKPTDLPPALDLETTDGVSASTVLKKVKIWIGKIKQAFNRRPIIYTGSYFWDDNIFSTDYASYPLWIPHYTSKPCPLVPNPWKKWVIWQYSDKGSVPGVSGNTDVNRFNGTLSDLKAFVQSTHIVSPPPPPKTDPPATPDTGAKSPDSGATAPDAGPPQQYDDGGPADPDTGPGPNGGAPWFAPPAAADPQPGAALLGGCHLGHGAGQTGVPGMMIMAVMLVLGRLRHG